MKHRFFQIKYVYVFIMQRCKCNNTYSFNIGTKWESYTNENEHKKGKVWKKICSMHQWLKGDGRPCSGFLKALKGV